MDILKKQISTYFFYALFFVAGSAAFLLIRPFISTIILAFLTTFLLHPVYEFFKTKLKGRQNLASIASVAAVLLTVILPLIVVLNLTVIQVTQFSKEFSAITQRNDINLETITNNINQALDLIPGNQTQLSPEDFAASIQEFGANMGKTAFSAALRVGGGSFELATNVFVYLFLLYTLFPLHERISRNIANASPLDDTIDQLYISRILEMSKSMIKGTFTIALIQALVGGFLLLIFGFSYVLFLTVIMIVLGIIPIVGASIVLIPAGFYLMVSGSTLKGIIFLAITIVIVNNIDNVLRPYLVSKKAELHPALVLLGVLGGLQLFGVLGFIYGPVTMIILTTTIEIYYKHYRL